MRGARPKLAAIVAAVVAAVAAAAGVPPETGARLERALQVLDHEFVGSYTLTVNGVVEKPSGKDRQETLLVLALTRRADGTTQTDVLKAVENGKDVTEREREKAKAARAKPTPTKPPTGATGGRPRAGSRASADLRLPAGDDDALYRVGEPVADGDLLVVTFEPLPEHRRDEGIAHGRLAWRRDTLDPAWLEAELVALPTGMSRLTMRFEFTRSGEWLYPRLTATSGAGGLLWIKRKFNARMEISDLVPAPQPSPTPGS